ncbi:MAG: hypothetical protein AB8H03_24555 [Saprospiraceae bacterium]
MKYLLSIFVIILLFFNFSSCSDGKRMASTVVKNEIVAILRGKVKPQQVVAAFQKYKMETVKVIDKNTNTWMFTFDKKLIDPDQFLNSLQDSQFIKSAKFGEKSN